MMSRAPSYKNCVVSVLAALLLPMLPRLASAQEIAVPPVEEDTSRWSGDASFGLTVTEGNSQTLSLNFSARVAYVLNGRHTWSLATSVLRTRDGDDLKANRGNVVARYDLQPSARTFVTTQFRASYNRPAGIERRITPSVGFGYEFVKSRTATLSADAGLNWTAERFTDDTRQNAVYYSLTQEFRLKVNTTTELEQQFAFTPRPEDLGDYLLQGSLSMTTRIWKLLGVKTELRDEYDSTPFVDPVTGVARRSNDLTFITGLSVSF